MFDQPSGWYLVADTFPCQTLLDVFVKDLQNLSNKSVQTSPLFGIISDRDSSW